MLKLIIEFLEKHKKTDTKNRHAFYATTVFYLLYQYTNRRIIFLLGYSKIKIIQNVDDQFVYPFFGALNW